MVLQGRIRVEIPGQTVALGPEDAAYLQADLPHTFTALGREPAGYVLVIDHHRARPGRPAAATT